MTSDEKTGRPILPKSELIDGAYYVGRCRNATVARWSLARNRFLHWRRKFSAIFVETIKHPADDEHHDVFRVVRLLEAPKFEIPINDDERAFEGKLEDLDEYAHEMWRKPDA